jgi:transcriptional regulator with XRE-family HTH domain
MDVQTITTSSGERLVVISEQEYARLVEAAEDTIDGQAVEAFRRDLAAGDEELIPSEVVDRLLDGESRIRVWREYRGMIAAELADAADITQPFLSQLETGKRAGTLETLQSIAAAMGVSIQELATPPAYLQIKALLAEHPEGLTIAAMATDLRYSQGHIRASCRWLEGEGVVRRERHRFVLV